MPNTTLNPSPVSNSINNSSISQNYSHFIGKVFQLTENNVMVEEVIAEGGFSVVFTVRSSNGKRYALKRMCVNNLTDLEVCKQEINIIKCLSLTNNKILKYIDSSIQRQANEIYEILLLTKYCKLGGLVQLINDRLSNNGCSNRLSESEILSIFCDICEAVVDLHENGIIHRDLKIENVLIDDRPSSNATPTLPFTFVLCDFGSATSNVYDKRTSSQSVQTIAEEIQKYTTIAYRSPEMVDLYSNKPINNKSDIWSLGCLLYKLCYYQTPFGESLLAIQEGRFTLPDNKANFYSKQLNSIINYMLETDPSKRPDIYQVSHLVFSLAERPCPIKNRNTSECPSFSQLTMPLTESEWRRNQMAINQLKKQNIVNQGNESGCTTVIPRERPKANLNNANSIILPPFSNTNNSNTSINIKPRTSSNAPSANKQSPFPTTNVNVITPSSSTNFTNNSNLFANNNIFGFDDDFNSTPIHINANSNQNITRSPMNSINTNNKSPLLLPAPNERKSHRRSASHNTFTMQPSTQLKHSQTNMSDVNKNSTHFNQLNELSVSPKKNFGSNSSGINVLHISEPPVANLIDISNTHEDVKSDNVNNSNNPFVNDNFVSPLNENDLFGLEFDKLRFQNEQNIKQYHQQHYQMRPPQSTYYSPNVLNNIPSNTNQMKIGNSNFYQNNRTHVKSNSCSNIGLNQILNYNTNTATTNNSNSNNKNQSFFTHL